MGSKERILEAIKQNPNATYAGLAKSCGMSVTNVVYHEKKLIERGLVKIRSKRVVHETKEKLD
jgi:predicted transcriptional regulator